LLREILKQDRLVPLDSLFQLAWLIAFNAGLLDQAELKDINIWLDHIEEGIKTTALTLDSSPEQWQSAICDWLGFNSQAST